MIIYLAAPWKRRADARDARDVLKAAGFNVNSRWLDAPDNDSHEELQRQAVVDLEDLDEADVLVALNLQVSEGKAVEQGYALACGKPIVAVGPYLNIFQHLDEHVIRVDHIDEAIPLLRAIAVAV